MGLKDKIIRKVDKFLIKYLGETKDSSVGHKNDISDEELEIKGKLSKLLEDYPKTAPEGPGLSYYKDLGYETYEDAVADIHGVTDEEEQQDTRAYIDDNAEMMADAQQDYFDSQTAFYNSLDDGWDDGESEDEI